MTPNRIIFIAWLCMTLCIGMISITYVPPGCQGLVIQDAEALARLAPHLSKLAVPLEFVAVLWGKVDQHLKDQVEEVIAQSQHGKGSTGGVSISGASLDGSEAGGALQPGSHAECDVGRSDCQEGSHTESVYSSQQGDHGGGTSRQRIFTWEEVLARGSGPAGRSAARIPTKVPVKLLLICNLFKGGGACMKLCGLPLGSRRLAMCVQAEQQAAFLMYVDDSRLS
jgi:hypothetical protein